jgi:hypothetical protein
MAMILSLPGCRVILGGVATGAAVVPRGDVSFTATAGAVVDAGALVGVTGRVAGRRCSQPTSGKTNIKGRIREKKSGTKTNSIENFNPASTQEICRENVFSIRLKWHARYSGGQNGLVSPSGAPYRHDQPVSCDFLGTEWLVR